MRLVPKAGPLGLAPAAFFVSLALMLGLFGGDTGEANTQTYPSGMVGPRMKIESVFSLGPSVPVRRRTAPHAWAVGAVLHATLLERRRDVLPWSDANSKNARLDTVGYIHKYHRTIFNVARVW